MGIVLMVEGLPYFLCPDRMKQMVRIVLEMEDGSIRRMGFGLMLAGLAVVYLAMKG
jgi:uncharacterized protein YjeT (DUF2065 family)